MGKGWLLRNPFYSVGTWANVSFKHRFSTPSTESGHSVLQHAVSCAQGATASSDRGKRGRVSGTCGTQINAGQCRGWCSFRASDSKCAAGVINLAGAAHHAVSVHNEGLHLSWSAQFTSKTTPLLSVHKLFPDRSHCCAGLTWLYVLLGGEGLQGWHLSGQVIREDFEVWFVLSHSLYLAIYGKLRLRNSFYKIWTLCLVFCVLCAIPLGKNCVRHGALGDQALILTFPAMPGGLRTLMKVSDIFSCVLRKQFIGTGSLPVFLCVNMGI